MKLSNDEISRYSRQLLIPELGVEGQSRLLQSSVLVVGAGGLGAAVILYLAAAGIGKIGIVDYDQVEESNLQRQIIHDEARIGMPKSLSAKETVNKLNSKCECMAYETLLDSTNALGIIKDYDVIVDATDNVATRYLLNDAAVLLNKPLISGSALRMDGQLTVYHYQNGPCYRCIFPTPPPPETVTNCSDGGVLGVVPGLIGCMQALETIKLISGIGPSYSQKMLLVDALGGDFRTIKLRGRKKDCAVCGDCPSITQLIDYVQFCGSSANDKALNLKVLDPSERISCQDYENIRRAQTPHLLLDVRETVQFNICSLQDSLNIPWRDIEKAKECHAALQGALDNRHPVYVVCRLGNDSQLAVRHLKSLGFDLVRDIEGGLDAWAQLVDPEFPRY